MMMQPGGVTHARASDDETWLTAYHVTPTRSLREILREGLVPQIGKRSRSIGEEEAATYLFRNGYQVAEALRGWLGLGFTSSSKLAVLRVRIARSAVVQTWTSVGASGYEIATKQPIAPARLQVLSEDAKRELPAFFNNLIEEEIEMIEPEIADQPIVVLVLNDGDTWEALGDDQTQAAVLVHPETGALQAFDLSRFVRENLHLLSQDGYRMPIERAMKEHALNHVADCFDLDEATFAEVPMPQAPPKPRVVPSI